MSRSIEVIVEPDGSLKIDAVGFHGADCEKATAFLEQALGRIDNRQRKPEYNTRQQICRKQRVGR
jgi:hypothetical protein